MSVHNLKSHYVSCYVAVNPGVAAAGDVKCFGDDCYALAFGVPAVLMVVALSECASHYPAACELCHTETWVWCRNISNDTYPKYCEKSSSEKN